MTDMLIAAEAATATPVAVRETDRSRWIALYVLCAGMSMIVLDATVVNVALPSIQDSLGFSTSGLAWVVNAYLIAFGCLLLLAGRVGDMVGRRTIFLAGLAVFTGASLLCGVAQTPWMLVGARFAQGVGGAMTSAVILGMIVTMFPKPREQAKAIGVYGFVASAGGAVGLLAGGVITQSINWHWIFFVNVPIGVATILLAVRYVERDALPRNRTAADVPGAILITAALMTGVYTIVEPAAAYGWTDARTLSLAAACLVLLAAFLVREATAAHPLMPLRIFGSRALSGANLIQALMACAMFGTFFLGSLYLQRVQGYGPLRIGLAFLPVTVLMGIVSIRYAERLSTRFGARNLVVPGIVLILAGLVWFTQAPAGGSYAVHVLPVMVLVGLGGGVCFPAVMNLGMTGVTHDDAGLASGLLSTTAQVGGALGLAVLATVSAGHGNHLLAAGRPAAIALTGGYHVAFWIAAAVAAMAAVIAATMLRSGSEHR